GGEISRILRSPCEGIAVWDAIDVARRHKMASHRTNIGDIERCALCDFALHAQAETVNRGNLAVFRGTKDIAQDAVPERGVREIGNVSRAQLGGLDQSRIIKHGVKDQVALRAVVHHAEPATEDCFVVAKWIVSKAEARLGHYAPAIPAPGGKPPRVGEFHTVQSITAIRDDVPAAI